MLPSSTSSFILCHHHYHHHQYNIIIITIPTSSSPSPSLQTSSSSSSSLPLSLLSLSSSPSLQTSSSSLPLSFLSLSSSPSLQTSSSSSPYRSPTCSNKYIFAASPSNNYQGNLAPPLHHHPPIPPRTPSTALSTIAPVALHLHQPIYTIIYLNIHRACGKLLPNNCSTTAEVNTPWMATELLPMIHHHHYHHPDTCGRRCV